MLSVKRCGAAYLECVRDKNWGEKVAQIDGLR